MPDLAMCPGVGCPRKEECFRYMAVPNSHWQGWAEFTLELHSKQQCAHFAPIQEGQRVRDITKGDTQ